MTGEYRGKIREIKYPLKSILPTLASGGKLNARSIQNLRIMFHSGGEHADQWSTYDGQYHSATLPRLSSGKYRMHVEQVSVRRGAAGHYVYTKPLFRSRDLPASGLDKYVAYFRLLSDSDVKLLEAMVGEKMSRKFSNRDLWRRLEPVVAELDLNGIRLELQKVEIDASSVVIKLSVLRTPNTSIKAVFDFEPSRCYDVDSLVEFEVERLKVSGIELGIEMKRQIESELASAIKGLFSTFQRALDNLHIHQAYSSPTLTLCGIDEKRDGIVLRPVFGLIRN